MADIVGRESIIGLKKAAVWGTAVAAAANSGFLIRGDFDLGMDRARQRDESVGLDWVETVDAGALTLEGSMPAWLRYEGLETVLALVMGTAGAPAQQAATIAYKHTLQLATVIDGLYASVAAKKKSDLVFEFPSVKIVGVTIKGSMMGPTEITFQVVANDLARNAAGGTNNTTTIATVTYRSKGLRAFTDENATLWMNDQSAAALAAGDAIKPSEWTLTFRRPLKGDNVVDGTRGIDEPRGEGFPEPTLELKFPQLSDAQATFWTNFDANTAKKARIYLRGPLIVDTYYYEFVILMPHLKIAKITSPISGPGKIPTDVTFEVLKASAAPTGMAVTKPFQVEIQNTITTDALA
jgi:hypothetical protein